MIATCADYGFFSQSDFDQTVWLDLPSSGRLQIQINSVITEITEAGFQSFHFQQGYNTVRLITESGAIVMNGKLWGSDGTSMWTSLFPPGADPFLVTTPGASSPSATTPGSSPSSSPPSGSAGIGTPPE